MRGAVIEEYIELQKLRHQWVGMMADVRRVGVLVGSTTNCRAVPEEFFQRIRLTAGRIRELQAKYPKEQEGKV